ncbi:MAG: AIR synthase related protein [Candidatus Ranarchaeia archaeon]
MELPIGKLPFELLDKYVFTHLPLADISQGHRLDFNTSLDDPNLIVATDPVVGVPLSSYGYFAVHYSAGDVILSGATPQYLSLGIYYPPKTSSDWLANNMRLLGETAKTHNIQILGGHTGSYPGIERPIISTTCIGKLDRDPLSVESIQLGDHLLLSGPVTQEFAWFVANESPDLLPLSLGKEEKEDLAQNLSLLSLISPAKAAIKSGAKFLHDVTEGGLVNALWEIQTHQEYGIEVHSNLIPWHEIGTQLVKKVEGNPLACSTYGSLLICCSPEKTESVINTVSSTSRQINKIGEFISQSSLKIYDSGKEIPLTRLQDPYAKLTEALWSR